MHAKRCHRFCDSKIVSIYFLATARNKYLYVMPLRGRTDACCLAMALVEGDRALLIVGAGSIHAYGEHSG
jgi:hypothetical protein